MKKVLFLLFLFSVSYAKTQVNFPSSLISSGGDYLFNSDVSFTYTIGEISSDIISYDTIELSQGFLQYYVLTSVGIEHNFVVDNANFIVYPNPFKDNITVRQNNNSAYKIVIKDITGREIMQKENLTNNTNLELSELNNGIYFINIIEKDKIYTKKIIKTE